MEHAAELIEKIQWQRIGFLGSNSAACPFYAALSEEFERDIEHDGPFSRFFQPWADSPFDNVYLLRFLGGWHKLALSGASPELAAHFPSTGGDADAVATMRVIQDLLADPPEVVVDAMTRPPQTNEVGRSSALASGFLMVAARYGLPLRLREVGSSAGLNLRPDAYWYEQDGVGCGDPSSPVRFVDLWSGGTPPFEAGLQVEDRRGCDRDPIDTTDPDGMWRALSYVWPEPAERFTRAADAFTRSADTPVVVDQADAQHWVPRQLIEPHPGTATVVYHSVVWQYLDADTHSAIRGALATAGAAATTEAPVAWLRLEPHAKNYVPAELRLTLWDGTADQGVEQLLSTTGFHGGPITWLAGGKG